jgi:hypothetical protein
MRIPGEPRVGAINCGRADVILLHSASLSARVLLTRRGGRSRSARRGPNTRHQANNKTRRSRAVSELRVTGLSHNTTFACSDKQRNISRVRSENINSLLAPGSTIFNHAALKTKRLLRISLRIQSNEIKREC